MRSALHRYFWGLPLRRRQQFAERVGTSYGYLRIHIIPPLGQPRKIPRRELMEKMAPATKGKVTYAQVLAHFYNDQPLRTVVKPHGKPPALKLFGLGR